MGNVLYVIFRYFIDTQAGVVRVGRLLLHKGDANNVLPVHRCIVPALLPSSVNANQLNI